MEDLVLKAKKGNREAFLKLIQNRTGVLYKIAYSYFKNSDEAGDAVQDAILIAFKNIRNLKEDGKFNSWITSILVNRCRDILRRNNRFRFEEYTDETVGVQHPAAGEYLRVESSIDILNSLQKLDEKHREVITLKYLGDYSINEISSILNIPEGTVKSRLNTGLRSLRSMMEVKEDGMQSCI
jgi:RNA polymerase sigma-70 factor (ECF subfamily)